MQTEMKIAIVKTINGVDYFFFRENWDLDKQLSNMLRLGIITEDEYKLYLSKYGVTDEKV